jgi:hypothetical protein
MDGYSQITIHADHMGMTKFDHADHPGYVKVLGELQRWLAKWNAEKSKEAEQVRLFQAMLIGNLLSGPGRLRRAQRLSLCVYVLKVLYLVETKALTYF